MVGLLLIASLLQSPPTGGIQGVVRDAETGRPLVGAHVSVREGTRVALTTADGRYQLDVARPGANHVVVHALGYAERVVDALVPRAGRLTMDVALMPHPLDLPPLHIRSTVHLDPRNASLSVEHTASPAEVRARTVGTETEPLGALLSHGVRASREGAGGLFVRGGGSDETAYRIDGIPIFNPFHAPHDVSGFSPDALSSIGLRLAPVRADLASTLSGTVEAHVRPVGVRTSASGTLSSRLAGFTVSQPVGGSGGGFVVSQRVGVQPIPGGATESSYVDSETQDLLASIQLPWAGGSLRLLGFGAESELGVAGAVTGPGGRSPSAPHAFGWQSASFGATWERDAGPWSWSTRLWHASTLVEGEWAPSQPDSTRVRSRRADTGWFGMLSRPTESSSVSLSAQVDWRALDYRGGVRSDTFALVRRRQPHAALTFAYAGRPRPNLHLALGATGTRSPTHAGLLPQISVAWSPVQRTTVGVSAHRSEQHEQSYRNPESLARLVFPVDLFVPTPASDVPATATHYELSVDLGLAAGLDVRATAYSRRFAQRLLVARLAEAPFLQGLSTHDPSTGPARARGLFLRAEHTDVRHEVRLEYGREDVEIGRPDAQYQPHHAAAQSLTLDLLATPRATWSIRTSAIWEWGRRATPLAAPFEWEACNLADLGCEFAGAPVHTPQETGRVSLPPFARVDLGIRKHWHLPVRGRSTEVAVFGTWTNLLGHENVLTYAPDSETGRLAPLLMRPASPLVLGLDWRY